MSSWLRVIFLIYDPLSFLFHLEPLAHDLESFFSFMSQSNLFHLEPWAHDLVSFFSFMTHSHFFCKLTTHSRFSCLWPRIISFPFRALSSWPRLVFLFYDPKPSFPFRALSSRPEVIILVYDLESFIFHLEPWAHDLDSFLSFMTQSHFFSI